MTILSTFDLLLVRHGQSQHNLDQTGGDDSPLTELGRRQAERVGHYLAGRYQITALYASPMQRARETAEIINQNLGLPLQFLPDLREAEGPYWAALNRFSNPLQALEGGPVAAKELSAFYAEFQARVVRAAREILRVHPEGQVLVVSHGGVMSTFVRTLTGSHQVSVHSANTCLHHLRWEQGRWHIVCLNRIHHLLGADDLVSAMPIQEEPRE